jgi:hypothetical protein
MQYSDRQPSASNAEAADDVSQAIAQGISKLVAEISLRAQLDALILSFADCLQTRIATL